MPRDLRRRARHGFQRQSRQLQLYQIAERDRFDSENDYKTNMKSEMEIRLLHQKLDQLNEVQWPHILDIQKMQIEVLSEIENEIQSLKTENEPKRGRNTRHPSKQ